MRPARGILDRVAVECHTRFVRRRRDSGIAQLERRHLRVQRAILQAAGLGIAPGRTLSGFVNLPPVDEREHSQHGLTLDQQIRAGRDVIRETARYYVKPIGVNTLIA